jgi:hypothetical protein
MNKSYRKRPVIVQAEQFIVSSWPWPEGVDWAVATPDFVPMSTHQMMTKGGMRYLNDGDWIITGAEGCRYPCKESIFKMYYEEIL